MDLIQSRLNGLRHAARATLTKYAEALGGEDRMVLTTVERYAAGAMRAAAVLEVLVLVEQVRAGVAGDAIGMCDGYIASLAARAGDKPEDDARLRAWVQARAVLT